MVWHIVSKVEDPLEKEQLFDNHFFKFPLKLLDKSANKVLHSGCIACLSKIIINCPDDLLLFKMEMVTDTLIDLFKMKGFQATKELLECLISIIFHTQEEFSPFFRKFMPILLDQIKRQKDPVVQRVAIDAVYTIGAHLSNEILSYREEIMPLLDQCRTSRNQPVRSAARETINLIREIEQENPQSTGETILPDHLTGDMNDVILHDTSRNVTPEDDESIKFNPALLKGVES